MRYGVGLVRFVPPARGTLGSPDNRKGEGRKREGPFPGKVVKDKPGVNSCTGVESPRRVQSVGVREGSWEES